MSTIYTIGEVAERSGFSSSALRYYESIGLVAPSARSEAGYRLYDGAALERLRFVARAKHLGCSLEEITDLIGVWDGGECHPVQRRLHQLVTEKIDDAHRQAHELVAFGAQLETAAAHLAGPASDGPCDEGCACVRAPEPPPQAAATPVPLVAKPSDPPIACTLEPTAMPDRLDEWRAVLDRATTRSRAADGALRVQFGADVDLAGLARLVAAERSCCAFFAFTITVDDRGVALEVRAPAEADDIVESLFSALL